MNTKELLLVGALAGLSLSIHAETAHAKKTTEAVDSEKSGECHGANSCKGTSACHSESNSCAGTNSCKGKGWIKLTKKECLEKKGKFKAD
jgi:hypothetical protein